MYTFRHNLDLKWRTIDNLVCAPRRFVINNNIRYVHIVDFNCSYVQIYDHLYYLNNASVMVAKANYLKLHSNTKGLYFNYSYWVNNYKKKTIRVYICE